MVGRLIALLLMVLGWFFLLWLGDLFTFQVDLFSYMGGCIVAFGASLLWE